MMKLFDLFLGRAINGSGGGGSATLITKSITANGEYSAQDDGADGYSSVSVNVPEQIKTLPYVPQTKDTDIIIVNGIYYLWKED